MDQKNTIVKCKVHPDCLFCHNGICDSYAITIGADGSCQEYVETEWLEQNKEYYDSCFYCQHALHEKNNKWLYCEIDGLRIDRALRGDQCKQFQSVYSRGQRANCDFYEDGLVDPEIVKEVCQPFLDVNDELQKIISSCILTPEETGVGLKRLASLVDQSKRAAERCKYLSPEEKEWTACPYMVRGNCTHPSADNITACCYMSTEEVIDEI